jgi:hypothetical protein
MAYRIDAALLFRRCKQYADGTWEQGDGEQQNRLPVTIVDPGDVRYGDGTPSSVYDPLEPAIGAPVSRGVIAIRLAAL